MLHENGDARNTLKKKRHQKRAKRNPSLVIPHRIKNSRKRIECATESEHGVIDNISNIVDSSMRQTENVLDTVYGEHGYSLAENMTLFSPSSHKSLVDILKEHNDVGDDSFADSQSAEERDNGNEKLQDTTGHV